jgi:hypothetical protein
VRRPFFRGRASRLFGLNGFQALRQPENLRPQGLQLLLLAIHHVTQFRVGALQESDLGLDLLEVRGIHIDSGVAGVEEHSMGRRSGSQRPGRPAAGFDSRPGMVCGEMCARVGNMIATIPL